MSGHSGVGGETQLMADGCVALLRLILGENNWYRWNDIKQQTQTTDFQTFVSWLLDAAEEQINSYDIRSSEWPQESTSTKSNPVLSTDYEECSKQEAAFVEDDVEILDTEAATSLVDHERPCVRQEISSSHLNSATDTINFSNSDSTSVEIIHIPENDSFRCNICNVSLSDVMVVNEHWNLRHNGCVLMINCLCCSQTFTSVTDYVEYHKQHGFSSAQGNKAFICNYCAKGFRFKHMLQDHVNNKHLKLGPSYQCKDCGKCYSYSRGLASHRKQCMKSIQQ